MPNEIDYNALVEAFFNKFMTMNASTIKIGDKTYRNLQAQVRKNQLDIQDLDLEELNTLPGRVDDLEDSVESLAERTGDLETNVAGKAPRLKYKQVLIPVIDWVNNQVTVSVVGMTDEDSQIVWVSPSPSNADAAEAAGIRCISKNTDVLVFSCKAAPATDITMNLIVANGGETL